jgi:hypothetical protein
LGLCDGVTLKIGGMPCLWYAARPAGGAIGEPRDSDPRAAGVHERLALTIFHECQRAPGSSPGLFHARDAWLALQGRQEGEG